MYFFSKLDEALKAIRNLTTTVSELEAKNDILTQKVNILCLTQKNFYGFYDINRNTPETKLLKLYNFYVQLILFPLFFWNCY